VVKWGEGCLLAESVGGGSLRVVPCWSAEFWRMLRKRYGESTELHYSGAGEVGNLACES
jgi:hypothetical protein